MEVEGGHWEGEMESVGMGALEDNGEWIWSKCIMYIYENMTMKSIIIYN